MHHFLTCTYIVSEQVMRQTKIIGESAKKNSRFVVYLKTFIIYWNNIEKKRNKMPGFSFSFLCFVLFDERNFKINLQTIHY